MLTDCAATSLTTKRSYNHSPCSPPKKVKKARHEDKALLEIGPESTFYRLIYKEIKLEYASATKPERYYKSALGLMDHYRGGQLLVVFFKPHYNFLDLVMHCLRDVPLFVIGITAGAERCLKRFDVPVITNGKSIIKSMKVLDPLGGGIYPLDCCVLFDKFGYAQYSTSWQNCGHDAEVLNADLIDMTTNTNFTM